MEEKNISAAEIDNGSAQATDMSARSIELLDKATEFHKEAAKYNVNTVNTELNGNKLKRIVKRIARKIINIFFGWYVTSAKERQTKYNEAMHSMSNIMLEESYRKIEYQRELERDINALSKRLNEADYLLQILKTQNEYLSKSLLKRQEEAQALSSALKKQEQELQLLKTNSGGGTVAESAVAVGDEFNKYFSYVLSKLNISYDPKLIEDGLVDYFDFENKYRGSRESIKERQLQYLPYLERAKTEGYVLELGFGRGEILEFLTENDIGCIGVDVYLPFVEYCSKLGYNVAQGDALTYLSGCEDDSLGGIVLSQVAEHVNTDYLYQLIRTGYKKLRKGCCFIIETPNPESLATYINFNLDGSHIKPVHYLALDYVFKSNGYTETVRLRNEYSEHPYAALMQTAMIDKCDDEAQREFFLKAKDMLFGATDLSIIAIK